MLSPVGDRRQRTGAVRYNKTTRIRRVRRRLYAEQRHRLPSRSSVVTNTVIDAAVLGVGIAKRKVHDIKIAARQDVFQPALDVVDKHLKDGVNGYDIQKQHNKQVRDWFQRHHQRRITWPLRQWLYNEALAE